MRFSRSKSDLFKKVLMKDLPVSVQDKIKTLSYFLDITEGAVIHAIVTDWVAQEAAEISLFGKRTTSDVYPFQFDNFTNVVLGNDLFSLLKAEHMKELTSDEPSAKTHEQHLNKIREDMQKSKEDVEEKIESLLRWAYENTDILRTPAMDKTLSYTIFQYQRAGFSEDELKALLTDEAEYLKTK
ncbi:hypothetical protein ACFL9U_06320 [Thermodesulfobacteriota bacterium]